MSLLARRFVQALLTFALVASSACGGGSSDPVPGDPGDPGDPGVPPGGEGVPECCGIDAVETLTPEQGWTLSIPPFAVAAGTEVTDCYFVAVPDLNNGQDIWIDKIKIGQRPGSHHMNIFRVNTVVALD